MEKEKQEPNYHHDDEGWFVDPDNPNREIKVEVCDNGDTLYGSRPREKR